MANGSLKITRSVFFVILISEIIGLFGLLFIKYRFDIFANRYQRTVIKNYEEKNDVSLIMRLLYQHEVEMANFMRITEYDEAEKSKKELSNLELQIRKSLIKYSQLIRYSNISANKKKVYLSVKDDVLNYLNYNSVLYSFKKYDPAADEYVQEYIIPLISRVNSSIEILNNLADEETASVYQKMGVTLLTSNTVTIIVIIALVISIVFCLVYSLKNIKSLEIDNTELHIMTDVQTSMLEEKQKRIADIQKKTIIGIADLIESRSGETGQHVKRTSKYVEMIAKALYKKNLYTHVVDKQYIELISRAAPLHDVGKIIIPDNILNKPGVLRDEEYEIMKTHAAAGGKIILNLLDGIEDDEYNRIAYDIATYHHEQWDGKGYPNGLMGYDIPLSARIMAVADVFDALVSERCYKKTIEYEAAFDLILSKAGNHLDPIIVDVFIELKDEVIKNDKKYK